MINNIPISRGDYVLYKGLLALVMDEYLEQEQYKIKVIKPCNTFIVKATELVLRCANE